MDHLANGGKSGRGTLDTPTAIDCLRWTCSIHAIAYDDEQLVKDFEKYMNKYESGVVTFKEFFTYLRQERHSFIQGPQEMKYFRLNLPEEKREHMEIYFEKDAAFQQNWHKLEKSKRNRAKLPTLPNPDMHNGEGNVSHTVPSLAPQT